MGTYSISYKARSDLKEIGRYTQKKWGTNQRNKYLGALFKSFDRLAADELVTIDCTQIRVGYRNYHIGRHIVFYRVTASGTFEIIRILHEAMDIESHLR